MRLQLVYKPIALACLVEIGGTVHIPVSGIGGIFKASDALEFMMLGATTVQICTGLLWRGLRLIEKMLAEMEAWLEGHGYASVKEVIGAALPGLLPFEQISTTRRVAVVEPSLCNGCGLCTACAYQAITLVGKLAVVDPGRCDGCGLCVGLCGRRAIVISDT